MPTCDASLAPYLADLDRHPRLTQAQERRLARRALAGDAGARRRLIEGNLRLVVWIARRYTGMGLELADLVQEGNIGLLRAVDRYDPERGPFAACAQWWIRQAICRALTARSRLVRVPVRLAESPEFRQAERPHRSLSEPVGDDAVLADLLSDAGASDPAAVTDDAGTVVRAAFGALDARRRRALELRFGLDGAGERTLAQVADTFGISAERARRLHDSALRALSASDELQALRAA